MSEEMKKEEKIKVVYVEAEKEAQVREIENTPEAIQVAVGGQIEYHRYFDDPVLLICGSKGRFSEGSYNRAVYDEHTGHMVDVIAGNFFICYASPDCEHYCSLPLELLKKYRKMFHRPEFIVRTGVTFRAFPMEPAGKRRDRRDDRR